MVRTSLLSILFGCALSGLAQGNPAKLTAYWNFDDASSTNTLDLKHGIVGQLSDGAIYTDVGGGRSGTGTDRSVDFGTTAQRQKVRVPNVEWLNQLTRSGDGHGFILAKAPIHRRFLCVLGRHTDPRASHQRARTVE